METRSLQLVKGNKMDCGPWMDLNNELVEKNIKEFSLVLIQLEFCKIVIILSENNDIGYLESLPLKSMLKCFNVQCQKKFFSQMNW